MSPLFLLLWGDEAKSAAVAAGLDDASWRALDRQAGQHRLRPLLHWRSVTGSWSPPPDLAALWHGTYKRSALRALGQHAALARIGAAFLAGGVAGAVLKGGAFIWTPGLDPALRPMRDLDVLITPDDAARVVEILSGAGFAGSAGPTAVSGKHLPAMTSGKVMVEPHLHLFDTFDEPGVERERKFIERAWKRAEPAVVPGLSALCPTDTLLHLILHAVQDHQFNNGPLLLGDLQQLTGSGRIDWALFWDEAGQLEAIRACQLALGLGQELAGISVDWCGNAPSDLGPDQIDRAARLMLVDMAHRSAVGWPGQLLRLSPLRWPKQLVNMLRRRDQRDAGTAAPESETSLRAAIGHALSPDGREKIADAVSLTFWLRRGA